MEPERLYEICTSLVELEEAMLTKDMDMVIKYNGPSPSLIAEELNPGFDSIEYMIHWREYNRNKKGTR